MSNTKHSSTSGCLSAVVLTILGLIAVPVVHPLFGLVFIGAGVIVGIVALVKSV